MLTCAECKGWLADHADDRLGDAERQWLEDHLAICRDCRAQLARERRLGALLRETISAAPREQLLVWPECAAAGTRASRSRAALVAVCLAALVPLALAWRAWPSPKVGSVARASRISPVAAAERSLAELEAEIEREAIAAQLAASAEVLASQPAANDYAAEAMRFVAEVFPETKAGRDAAVHAGRQTTYEEPL